MILHIKIPYINYASWLDTASIVPMVEQKFFEFRWPASLFCIQFPIPMF